LAGVPPSYSLRSVSTAGTNVSSIVFSPVVDLPRFLIISTPFSIMAINSSKVAPSSGPFVLIGSPNFIKKLP
jgi:hypothetical protein